MPLTPSNHGASETLNQNRRSNQKTLPGKPQALAGAGEEEASAESGWCIMGTPDSPDALRALMAGEGELVPGASPQESVAMTAQSQPASPYLAWADARARLGQFFCGGSQGSTSCPGQLVYSESESEN